MPFVCPGCRNTFGNDRQRFRKHLGSCAPGILQATLVATEIALNVDHAAGEPEEFELHKDKRTF